MIEDGRNNLITSTESLNYEMSQTRRQNKSITVALKERAYVESKKMYQVSRQLSGVKARKKEPPDKIKC